MKTLMVLALLLPFAAASAQRETGFLNRSLRIDDVEYRYQIYVPRNYSDTVAWPIILALHGSGERGTDGMLQTQVGLAAAIRRQADRYPAIVVFPQSPLDSQGWRSSAARAALAALDMTQSEFKSDSSRVYLTGYSMGGNGTWYLAYQYPERFAALVVVCGFVNPIHTTSGVDYTRISPTSDQSDIEQVARRVSTLPIWIFQGDADPIVPVDEARRIVAALRLVGNNPRYTELPGVGHNAWDPAYDNPDLPTWLFSQRRK